MKRASLLIAVIFALTSIVRAELIVQNFTTGQISPGTHTPSAFQVNQFDTSLGTLTRVTLSISLDSWGGSYEVENTTVPSTVVNGSMSQGISAVISGSRVPDSMVKTLFAGKTELYTLAQTGDKIAINGPAYASRNQAGPSTQNAAAGDFGLYKGTGTYIIDFYSSQNNSHTADGSTAFAGTSAWSEGFLIVTYEYTVPEPTSLAMLAFGCVALGLRRRVRSDRKA